MVILGMVLVMLSLGINIMGVGYAITWEAEGQPRGLMPLTVIACTLLSPLLAAMAGILLS